MLSFWKKTGKIITARFRRYEEVVEIEILGQASNLRSGSSSPTKTTSNRSPSTSSEYFVKSPSCGFQPGQSVSLDEEELLGIGTLLVLVYFVFFCVLYT